MRRLEELRTDFDQRGVKVLTVSVDLPEVIADRRHLHGLNATMLSDQQLLIREHRRVQTVQMAAVGNNLRKIHTHREHLYTALIKISAQLFESTQLADTVGSPMRSEKLNQYQVSIQNT